MRPVGWLLLSLLSASPALAADRLVQKIEIWTRAAGRYATGQTLPRARVVTIDVDQLPFTEGPLVDWQYGGTRTCRYVPIAELIRRYGPPPEADTALLHFANGMAIPLPFRDATAMRRLSPMLVRSMSRNGRMSSELPPISRTDDLYFDVRPIVFQGNKVAVEGGWHPALRAGSERMFSPWQHADTLTGIELVDDGAFLRQFAGDPSVQSGARTYGEVCRFCHGAYKEGAQFGWDFVEPIPIYEVRTKPVSLYYHVKYRAQDAPTRGLRMPALPYLTEKDAAELLSWLRAIASRPLAPYRPRTAELVPSGKEP